VLRKNSVQPVFGGFGLLPTIKKTDETFTDLSNLVAVKQYNSDAAACTTSVLAERNSVPLVIAAFIWTSILRMT
jgi:hypothetical protein